MIGADGCGADEFHRAACEQGGVDSSDGTRDQALAIAQVARLDIAAGLQGHSAQLRECVSDAGNILIGQYFHETQKRSIRPSSIFMVGSICAIGRNSSGWCACSIEPGPMTMVSVCMAL